MATQEVTIKCGSCKVPVEGPANPQDNDRFACPRCGRNDTLENIMSEAQESAMDQVESHIDSMLTGMARSSKMMSYKSGARHQKQRRFIVEMKM